MKYNQARFIGSFPDYGQSPRTGLPEIAFGGRSNVGKSSLINSLLNRRKLAQISKSPGKTKLLNFFEILNDRGKESIFFVDLPGYGYARVAASVRESWKGLVEGYIESSRKLRGFVLLIDSRRGIEEEEIQLVEYLLSKERKVCPVLTKADKLPRQAGIEIVRHASAALRPLGADVYPPILHSSVKRMGNEHIWHWIDERISNAAK
jgi:GTP-binding protein